MSLLSHIWNDLFEFSRLGGKRRHQHTQSLRNFIDQTGGLWANGALIGKVGSVFCSTATQHGGQETTLTSFHTSLLHHGMVIVGLPYSHPGLGTTAEVAGGTPYGASCVTGQGESQRMPSALELDLCRFQGEHVAGIAARLSTTRSA
jgi:NAD(P)H:quinone oxidoreductase type IV